MHHQLFIIRRENRLSQKAMAAVLRINSQTYHLKESGKTDFTLKEAIKLANHFNRSLDSLFGKQKEGIL
jgi:putative transcriptional regulator